MEEQGVMIGSKNDELVMKLLHYFIADKDYNPIVLHGAKNEIWLENLDSEYPIVRIVTDYIHNDEQFQFDLLKTRSILKKIKKKTVSLHMEMVSFYLNLGDNVHMIKEQQKYEHISCVSIPENLSINQSAIFMVYQQVLHLVFQLKSNVLPFPIIQNIVPIHPNFLTFNVFVKIFFPQLNKSLNLTINLKILIPNHFL